jgi:hypothetical protein
MLRLRTILAAPLVLVASWAAASEVRDNAKIFSAGAVREAESALNRIERERHVPVVIETIESLPQGESIGEASLRRAKQSGLKGLYVLIAKANHKIETRDYHQFLGHDRDQAITNAFLGGFRNQGFDEGLSKGVQAIRDAIEETGGLPAAAAPRALPARGPRAPAVPVPHRGGGGSSGLGVLLVIGLVILAVLVGLRILGGLFRGAAGYAGAPPMGRPGYGPPGAGYGAGYGGRGGGFFSGLLGGLGGAVAGNWLYDQFGRHHGGGYTSGDAGNVGGEGSPAAPDAEWGGAAGDWGGGDAGGGGGDWGGGDAGGGGDWGGGGGGDWGGGGGDGGGGW